MSFPNAATTAETDRIASLAEPVLRNLTITQCYSELSTAFAQRMGPVSNWCSFATWASKQAGQTIREQDLKQSLAALLQKEPEIEAALSLVAELAKQAGAKQRLDQLRQSAFGIVLSSAANTASEAVSRGNKKVFEEIAREFARFMSECFNDTSYDPAHIDRFCESLLPGPAPEGQDYLRRAFRCYYLALFETDPQQKTELNLLANLQIGFHEQTRLQPEIAEALNAGFDAQELKTQLLEELRAGISFRSRFMGWMKQLLRQTGLLDEAVESLLQRVQYHLRRTLTLHLMTLTIPQDRRLRLGLDLSLSYPDILKQLCNADLLALLQQTDPTPGSLLESGAEDWASLPERMHFIGELFRCCHVSPELFDAPFSPEQVKDLQKGKIPEGNL
ncbi:hypothetical protein [Terrimonas alba]|uniref:hypothetical protein n=1 Tax=Terrimonas alba TaxID=3349636 RepID=UPI0035F455A9